MKPKVELKTKRIKLNENEISFITWLLDHFSDYMAYDNRPDHGLAVLSKARDFEKERKESIYFLAGKFKHRWNKSNAKNT